MTEELNLFKDLALILAFVIGGIGLFRSNQIRGLRDSNDFLAQRDEVRQRELDDLKAQYTKLQADYDALRRVVTNEAYMTALAERLAGQWTSMSQNVMAALEAHNEIARQHWEKEEITLVSIRDAIEDQTVKQEEGR